MNVYYSYCTVAIGAYVHMYIRFYLYCTRRCANGEVTIGFKTALLNLMAISVNVYSSWVVSMR